MGSERTSKRVLLYGFYSQGNYGDDALLDAIVRGVRESCAVPVDFTVPVRYPSGDMDRQFGIRTIQNLEYNQRADSVGRWLQGFNPDDGEAFERFMGEVLAADLVILGPGQYLVETAVDALWRGILAQLDAVAEICGMTGTPLYAIALTAEPLARSFSLVRVQNSLSKCSALSFRDSRSPEYLSARGIVLPSHAVAADLAFSTLPAITSGVDALLESEGLDLASARPLGMAVHDYYIDASLRESFVTLAADVCSLWIERTGEPVLFIPQSVNHEDRHADDRYFHDEVIERVPEAHAGRVRRVRSIYPYDQVEALYSACAVTFCTRMHGAIFSLKQCVPPVLMDHESKRRACFAQAGFEEFVHLVDTPAQRVVSVLEDLVESSEVRERIREALDAARESSLEHIRIASELLMSEPSPRKIWAKGLYQ